MDRVNEVTSQQHPKLVDFKKCKNKGIRAGLFSIITGTTDSTVLFYSYYFYNIDTLTNTPSLYKYS
jgi:hypothetical protein